MAVGGEAHSSLCLHEAAISSLLRGPKAWLLLMGLDVCMELSGKDNGLGGEGSLVKKGIVRVQEFNRSRQEGAVRSSEKS